MKVLKIYSDGGARGNPGPAGIGVVIKDISDSLDNRDISDKQDNLDYQDNSMPKGNMVELSEYIGVATNNQAEYKAVVKALEWVIENIKDPDIQIDFFLDSQLVVEQLNGNYKIKNEGLKPLFWQIRELILKIGGQVAFIHIPREENKEADRLVNEALDKESKDNL